MQLCNPIRQNVIWVFLLLTSLVFFSNASSASDSRISEAGLTCGSFRYSKKEEFFPNFVALMDIVSKKVNEKGWSAEAIDGTPPAMYALGQCHKDLEQKQCSACFNKARKLMSKCLPAISGRVYMDGCFLRYDNYSFCNESIDPRHDKDLCGKPTSDMDDINKSLAFKKRVAAVILNVTEIAGRNKFAVGGEGVFALAQCWETVDLLHCKKCLEAAAKKVKNCAPGAEGRALYTGCFVRYSDHRFYNNVEEIDTKKPTARAWKITAIVLSAIAFVLLLILGALISRKRIATSRKKDNGYGALPSFGYKAALNFRYEILEKATNSFDPSRKLGQGGAGTVFRGVLSDRRTVAVKRLFYSTRQWADELFNEVNLISGIEHKNLVRLLGCSIEGPESLLVYEFLPNRSLDQILFGKGTVDTLTWQQRYQIICGIAEGLAYLHGGCDRKIIHRYIKAGNILLDQNLNPKIADFGLARSCAADRSHVSTGIAGTLGYMAPEYLLRGQLTEKADVYAFGVLAIEIVCGKKNSVFTQGSDSILHCVWKNHKANCITASADPALRRRFSIEEASRALQAGLLCTQSSVSQRPSMSEVVQMLTNKHYVVPRPKHPPFLNASVLGIDDVTKTSTMSSVSSNRNEERDSSFNSTKSSILKEFSGSKLSESSRTDDDFFSDSGHFTATIGSPESDISAVVITPEPRRKVNGVVGNCNGEMATRTSGIA